MELIKPFEPGSDRTLLSASTANELVGPLNAFITARGENGIKIDKADGNVVITFTGNSTSNPNQGGGGGGGTAWTWRGDWVNQAYNQFDVVILQSASDIESADKAGTYLAVQAVPIGTGPGPGNEAYWALIARGNWQRLKFRFPGVGVIDIDPRGTDPASGGQPQLLITSEVDSSSALLRLADLGGQQARFLATTMCESGVSKTSYVFRTPTF